MKLLNQVGVVTGAGRNIGEAIAHSFAHEGANVAVVDINEQAAQKVADAINSTHPGKAMAFACDVSSGKDVEQLMDQVVERWGYIDILVNNVAITDHKTVLDLEEDEWDRVLSVTLKSVFLCTKFAAKKMVDRGQGGKVVNIASTSGHKGRADATAYTAAKGGVLNLTRSLAMQLAPYNIRVNSVTPNKIGSPVGYDSIPENRGITNLVGRNGVPEDIAKAVLFMVSDDASFITATDLLVDGGALNVKGP